MSDSFKDLGYAKTDMTRHKRTGSSEAIYCAGKTNEQLRGIFNAFLTDGRAVIGTRCSPEQAAYVEAAGLPVRYDPLSKILFLKGKGNERLNGRVAVCTAGTADVPVAEEAAQTAEFLGAQVDRFYDVGVAGIHRLFAKLDDIRRADAVIAVAGMEGALAGVIAGLVSVPVLAVPTSVGYGASFNGLAALLGMLNSCAEGVSVVNIDNGFGAAVTACRIIRGKIKND